MASTPEPLWGRIAELPVQSLLELFAADPARVDKLSRRVELGSTGIRFDWSKTHLTDPLIAAFEDLAQVMDFSGKRDALLSGQIVNPSEHRAATHTAERGVGEATDVEEAEALHFRMRMLVEAIHQGAFGEVKHLIHVGIGGSALGPALGVDALARDFGPTDTVVEVHVVSNIDGTALEDAFAKCDPQTTLVAIASKTFTTVETMTNANSVLNWLEAHGIPDPSGRVIALTASPDVAVEWGVDETRILPFPESVGGRYSLWSSIGFPVALAIGWDAFADMLAGARAMDEHFAEANGRDNLPLLAAFVDRYYASVRGAPTRAVFAYDERLRLLPSYLQQLEMESNGKSVNASGEPIIGPSAPITWGGVGTDAQHAVFQLLHQGTHLVPVEFVASIAPGDDLDPAHHRILLMNCFAQGAALMSGRESSDLARNYPGDRPSTTILLDDLDPISFGALLAFQEHRTFANAVLMGINPFDQFGVELGKAIARKIESGDGKFDASTTALLQAAGLA